MTTPEVPSTVTIAAKQAVLDLITKLREAGDFALAEAPEVVRQMVVYEATMAWLGAAVSLGLSAAVLYWTRRAWIALAHDTEERIWLIFTLFPLSLGVIAFCVDISTAIQATFFQKWFIVSRLVEIIK